MRQWLTSNAGLKVIALILAIFVWLFVKAVNSNSRIVDLVPVEIKPPAGMAVAYYSPTTISVTVRGPTEDLRTVNRFELFAGLNLPPNDSTNSFEVTLKPRDVNHPRHVSITDVEPAVILVRLKKNTE
jgi:YbbR domain-containing protein